MLKQRRAYEAVSDAASVAPCRSSAIDPLKLGCDDGMRACLDPQEVHFAQQILRGWRKATEASEHLGTLHYTYYILDYILFTIYYKLYTIYYILYTIYYIYYILCTMYYVLCTIYYILYTIYYILYTIYYILYTIYYTSQECGPRLGYASISSETPVLNRAMSLYYTILYYTMS